MIFKDNNMKKCSTCKIKKELTEFNKRKASKDGLRSQCRSCRKEYLKKWYQQNKERHNEYAKEWYQQNKKLAKVKRKEYYQQNKGRLKESAKEYYQKNKESLNE